MASHEHRSVLNHWQFDSLSNNLFKLTWNKASKPMLLALCEGNPSVTAWFHSQMWKSFPGHDVFMSSALLFRYWQDLKPIKHLICTDSYAEDTKKLQNWSQTRHQGVPTLAYLIYQGERLDWIPVKKAISQDAHTQRKPHINACENTQLPVPTQII